MRKSKTATPLVPVKAKAKGRGDPNIGAKRQHAARAQAIGKHLANS